MVDDSQTSSLQQPNTTNNATGNPQQIGGSSLQIPGGSNLQTTSSQSVSSLNQLDQGGTAIPLSNIANSGTDSSQSSSQPATSTSHSNTVYVYGGSVILVLAIFGYMVYSLLRKH